MAVTDPLSEKIPYNLFREPLDYLFADHVRQTSICALIYEMSSDLDLHSQGEQLPDAVSDKIKKIIHYLGMELPLHIADEELDILPSLRNRALPEDGMDEILKQLGAEHAIDEELSDDLSRVLISALDHPASISEINVADIAGRFAEAHCGHMKWENAIFLPLARKRLTQEDLKVIGQKMANRRNVPYPD